MNRAIRLKQGLFVQISDPLPDSDEFFIGLLSHIGQYDKTKRFDLGNEGYN